MFENELQNFPCHGIIGEMKNSSLLANNEDVFSIGNLSEFSDMIGDDSDEELEAQQRIVEKWEENHQKNDEAFRE